MGQKFTVVNENLLFKDATALCEFELMKDKNKYLLYFVSDLETYEDSLRVSKLVLDGEYFCLEDIDDESYDKVKSYIDSLLSGEVCKKEIKLSRADVKMEPNICQSIIEKGKEIECANVKDVWYALENISSEFFDNFVYVTELNKAMCDSLIKRNNIVNEDIKKESMKGNVSILLLTLFAVCFLTVLIFMGYGLIVNG
jgi:hypothetical protein